MKRSTRLWLSAIGIVIGLIVLQRMISIELDTVDPVCDRVSQIRKDISHEACVKLARTGLLDATLKKDGISWFQVHGL
jgi:hypothetical protein